MLQNKENRCEEVIKSEEYFGLKVNL